MTVPYVHSNYARREDDRDLLRGGSDELLLVGLESSGGDHQRLLGLQAVIDDRDADWVYLRFVPVATEVAAIRAAGKRSFIAGATVAGLETGNWSQASAAGVDGIF